MTLLIVLLCILFLIVLITWGKFNPFLAFLVVSIIAALLLGIPASQVARSITKGIGDTLGSLIVIICLGAMLGKLVADSGAAQKITNVLMRTFGERYLQWALMITGFIVGIPLFYNVGFVLLVPLIFSVVYQYKLPAVYTGLPMLAALSVTHGFLPPHPSPTALVAQFNANMGLTLLYGMALAIPAIIVAGPVFSKVLRGIDAAPMQTFKPREIREDELPGTFNSFFTSLLPVLLLALTTVLSFVIETNNPVVISLIAFFADPIIVMLVSLLIATLTLGVAMGKSIREIMLTYESSVKDVAVILLIVAGAGVLKQVFTDSGVSAEIAGLLNTWTVHPLILGWIIASVIRVCVGSATVAGLTTAGIVAPVIAQHDVDPNLMVLSIGAGSLMFSHVNDSGFWMFKEYFNLSVKDTIKSWSIMESIVAVVGLMGVLVLNFILHG